MNPVRIVFCLPLCLLCLPGLASTSSPSATCTPMRDCDREFPGGDYCGSNPSSDCICYAGMYYCESCLETCKNCPDGTFAKYENRCPSCLPKTECQSNEEVFKNATAKSDQICKCRDWPIPREVREEYNCTDLSCPDCPVQGTTVTDLISANPPQEKEVPDNQWAFDGWSCVIGISVTLPLALIAGGMLAVFLKGRNFRLRLPCTWDNRNGDVEKKGYSSVKMVDNPDSSHKTVGKGGEPASHSKDDGEGDEPASQSKDDVHNLKHADPPKSLKHPSMCDQLKEYLPVFGMDIRSDVPGDGNCFYHAVSDQLKRLGLPVWNAKALREEVTNSIAGMERSDPIVQSLPSSEGERKIHLEKMAKDGTYVEGQEVAATARLLKHDLIVIKSIESGFMVSIHECATGDKRPLLLGLADDHYRSLQSNQDPPGGLALEPGRGDPAHNNPGNQAYAPPESAASSSVQHSPAPLQSGISRPILSTNSELFNPVNTFPSSTSNQSGLDLSM